jgi:rubredoxin
MALAAAYEDVKGKQKRNAPGPESGVKGSSLVTEFFSGANGLPHAGMSAQSAGRISYPHFHSVDQFQVLIKGKGKMGRHPLNTYSVHFSKAYTPYGPFCADEEVGLTFFNLHARPDRHWGAKHLPQEAETLKQVPNRRPWQITTQGVFPENMAANTVLQEIPGLRNEEGLAGYTLSMKPNTRFDAPDPSRGEGQYVVLVEGSIIHEGKELQGPALVFVGPEEPQYKVHAGPMGAKAFVFNYPKSEGQPKKVTGNGASAAHDQKVMGCNLCSFVYEEALGLSSEGIRPGTRWEDVPHSWTCPDCGASKGDFQPLEI